MLGVNGKDGFAVFNYMLTVKDLLLRPGGKDDNKVQRRALLLHCAGSDVQDIFDVLAETGSAKEYEKAKEALTRHFVTQVNVPYERHMFREMAQNIRRGDYCKEKYG